MCVRLLLSRIIVIAGIIPRKDSKNGIFKIYQETP